MNPRTNEVFLHDQQQLGDEDLLNFTAIHALRHGNTVYLMKPEEMPAGTFLAAIHHLPMAKHGKHS